MTQAIHAIIWERVVAKAAPATPILNVVINTMSKTIFATLEIIMKYKGVLLSPNALKIEKIISNTVINNIHAL